MAVSQAARDLNFDERALRYGFKYSVIKDAFVCDNGAYIPAGQLNRLGSDKLLELMEVAAKGMALHHASAPLQFTSQTPNKRSYYEKLAVRLDIPAGETFGYEHVHIIDSSNEVCILIKKDDQVVLLRDDKNLFPSDALIAKIRLL